MSQIASGVFLGLSAAIGLFATVAELNQRTEVACSRGLALCALVFAVIAGVLRMP